MKDPTNLSEKCSLFRIYLCDSFLLRSITETMKVLFLQMYLNLMKCYGLLLSASISSHATEIAIAK